MQRYGTYSDTELQPEHTATAPVNRPYTGHSFALEESGRRAYMRAALQ